MAKHRETQKGGLFAWTLRIFAILNAVTGIGFIAYGCILEYPVKTALPLGLVIVGCIGLIVALLGFIGSFYRRCCLCTYLVLGAIITIVELGLTLAMFFNVSNTVSNVINYEQKKNDWDEAKAAEETVNLTNEIKGGRWFFLVMVLLQSMGLLVAVVLRTCFVPKEQTYEDFEQGQRDSAANAGAQQQIQLEQLKSSVNRGAARGGASSTHLEGSGNQYASNSKLYRNVTRRMDEKYGAYDNTGASKQGWWKRTFG